MLLAVGLVATGSVLAAAVPPVRFAWLLLAFFAWQFWHFHRQNVGLVALAALSSGVGPLARAERRALGMVSCAGIAALATHPQLLQLSVDPRIGWLWPLTFAAFVIGAAIGVVALGLRRPGRRPVGFCALYVTSVLFWLPVWVFASPYAAVGGLTVAHGLQYLLLAGLVATGDRRGVDRLAGVMSMLAVALVVGAALSVGSHLHAAGASTRWLYGVYLGVVMTHFVVDGAIWRLRDPATRNFLSARVPFLVPPTRTGARGLEGSATDGSGADL